MKNIVSVFMVTLFIVSTFTLAFNIQPAKAEGTIYIRADGSIDPSTAPISTVDNVIYTFTDSIYDSIVVEKNNIAIDGDKHWVQGTGADESKGIDLSGRTNVAVRNTQITNFYYGIYLYSSSGNIIRDNNMTNNRGDGIKLSVSSENSIIGNNMTNNLDGIGLVDSEDNRIFENNVSDNTSSGIYLWRSNNNRIVWNEVEFNNLGIWLGESSNNFVCHNNFADNSQQSSIYSLGYSNVWNDVYPSCGNYWDNYAIVDSYRGPNQDQPGSDGILDTEYFIDENNTDNYPLVNPCVLARIVKNLTEALIGRPYLTEDGNQFTKGWMNGRFVDPEEIEYLDCSGLVYWSYSKAYGATRYSPWDKNSYTAIDKKEVMFHNPIAFEGAELQYWYNCEIISREELAISDLLFFDTPRKGNPDHVAVYVGGPFPFEYGQGEVFMYNTIEATAWGDNIITVAFFETASGYMTTLRPSTGGSRQLEVYYYGRVRIPVDLKFGQARMLGIPVKSPVNLVVTDPEGFTVTSNFREVSNMVYLELDTDGDDELDDMVVVLERKIGDYTIGVVPKSGAAPNDTYTLEVFADNTTTVMAQNVSIIDIPSNPYIVTSSEAGIIPRLDPHDIGVTGLDTTKNVIGQGFSLQGSVAIFNYGSFAETFNVTVYANTSVVAEFMNLSLAGRNSTAAIFTWNTTGFSRGNYTISAYVTPVANETVTMDNTLLDDREIRVTIPGDVDGDRDVDIFDIVRMAGIYGVEISDSRYDPNSDIDSDGDIDIFDIVIAAGNYGESW